MTTASHTQLICSYCKVQHILSQGSPSCLQMTSAASSSQKKSAHTVPQLSSRHTSTLPSWSPEPPTSRTSPLAHVAFGSVYMHQTQASIGVCEESEKYVRDMRMYSVRHALVSSPTWLRESIYLRLTYSDTQITQ